MHSPSTDIAVATLNLVVVLKEAKIKIIGSDMNSLLDKMHKDSIVSTDEHDLYVSVVSLFLVMRSCQTFLGTQLLTIPVLSLL